MAAKRKRESAAALEPLAKCTGRAQSLTGNCGDIAEISQE